MEVLISQRMHLLINKESKPSFNIFVELAEDWNDKNDDIINLNIFQKNSSSIRPMMSISKSINGGLPPYLPANLQRDSEISNSSPLIPPFSLSKPSVQNKHYPIPLWDLHEELGQLPTNLLLPLNSLNSESLPIQKSSDSFVRASLPVVETPRLGEPAVQMAEPSPAESAKNYNEEVERMLDDDDSGLSDNSQKDKRPERANRTSATSGISIRRHRKKSKKQVEILEQHFKEDEEWSLSFVEQLANQLNLEKDQVYKWNWDKRKRLRRRAAKEGKTTNKKQKVK